MPRSTWRRIRPAPDDGERVLEIVGDGREELIAGRGELPCSLDFLGLCLLLLVGLKLERDQIGEEGEQAEHILGQRARQRVQGAEYPKWAAITAAERDRDVALDAVQAPGRVIGEAWIGAGVRDEQRRDRAANIFSKRGRQVELESVVFKISCPVDDGTGCPRFIGDARDQRCSQARDLT